MVKKKSQEDSFRGLALSEEITKRMDATGTSPTDFAAMIDLSPSYTNSLMNGSRPWDGTSREAKKRIAEFLGVPLISVLLLAGIVEPQDFMYDDSIDESLSRVHDALKSDKVWGSFCQTKKEWNALPMNARILIALLFEKATETEIVKKAQLIKVVRKRSNNNHVKKPQE